MNAFARFENAGKGLIALDGRMAERLHLAEAECLPTPARNEGCGEMKLYRFLTGPDDASFCHKVTAALNKGWHIYGSPTYAFDAETKTMRCGQAVTKEVDGVEYTPDIKLGEY